MENRYTNCLRRKWLTPPFNWHIWSIHKPGKNEWCLTLDYGNPEAVVSPNKPQFLAPIVLEMTDSIHSAAAEHSAFTDLAKSVLFCVYFSSPSSVFGLLLWRDTDSFTWLPWGNLSTIATAQPQRAGSVLYPLCAMSIMSWALMTSLLRKFIWHLGHTILKKEVCKKWMGIASSIWGLSSRNFIYIDIFYFLITSSAR